MLPLFSVSIGQGYYDAHRGVLSSMESFEFRLYPDSGELKRLDAKRGFPSALAFDDTPLLLPVRNDTLPENGAAPKLIDKWVLLGWGLFVTLCDAGAKICGSVEMLSLLVLVRRSKTPQGRYIAWSVCPGVMQILWSWDAGFR
jgi:hypothetical protein